ncbi:uncharacterized protein LOC108908506 [Anoplophora glabripennis]|uniref:uncharacterized protein LOC108908506 n=1 Tax=Anoplophora glabripennis TaxID=217634 RepID=UPI0008745B6B|nr:uncharacterized protein LOC108908506 [Anoplophora glabripennis]
MPKRMSDEEIACESSFRENTRRASHGRFIVSMPLKQPPQCLGESQAQTINRFYSTERKLAKNPKLKERYVEFMGECEKSGHMSLVENNVGNIEYFMPHHGVVREESKTTKLRVVFDASAPSTNGISLNNIQRVGPVLQDDLFSILLRFRKRTYVISADIAKMYRQVLIEPGQRCLQKIIWRPNPSEALKMYSLNTVTYGQACASFLAIRCIFELVRECEANKPKIADIIRRNFYVDDLLTGADTAMEALQIANDVYKVLKSGSFELRKWYSNQPDIIKNLAGGTDCGILEFASDENTKTLGLI